MSNKAFKFLLFAVSLIVIITILSGCVSFKSTYSVSGYVTCNGNGLSGVTISFSDGLPNVVTNSQGYWSQSGLAGSVTVTATLSGYIFTPSSIIVTSASTDVDFTAVSQNITGTWEMTITSSALLKAIFGQKMSRKADTNSQANSLSTTVLILQRDDAPNDVAMIYTPSASQSYSTGGLGFEGTLNGNSISLSNDYDNSVVQINGTISSNGTIYGNITEQGYSATFVAYNFQPLKISNSNFDLNGSWLFNLDDQTENSTTTLNSLIYQNGNYLINLVTEGEIIAPMEGIAFWGTLDASSVQFLTEPQESAVYSYKFTGTVFSNQIMEGNFDSLFLTDEGTWTASRK